MTPLAATTATITVNAGGIRTGASTVSGLNGGTYQAVAVSGSPTGGPFTCVMSAGTCSITVPSGYAWNVSALTAASSYYLNPNLDSGSSSTGTSYPYVFRTGTLSANSTTVVPGASLTGHYQDANGQVFSGMLAQSYDNPPIAQRCGLNIALVLDQSGSMNDNNKQATLKSAATDVVDSLTGTPSSIGIYTFAKTTGASIASTSTATSASAQPLLDFINGLGTPSGATNWDAGLGQVPAGYDLVILLTDGNPTTYGDGSYDGNNSEFAYAEQGIFSANRIKATLGERLVTVGIGVNGGGDNIRAVSGPNQGDVSDPQPTDDYYLASSSNFDDVLKTLATGTCNNTVTIQKQIETPSGTIIDNSPAANGWNYSGSIASGSTLGSFPATATNNGSTGFTSAAVSIPGGATPSISLTETLQSGYAFDRAKSSCKVGTDTVSTTGTGTTLTFTGAANAAISCIFVNQQVAATVTVNKNWVIGGTTYANGSQPSGYSASLSLSGQTNPAFGTKYTGYVANGSVTIGETGVTVPSGCSNSPSGDIGTKTLAAGDNTFTITNTVTCAATVTVNKNWVINGQSYANGAQPAGYSASLTLTGQTSPSFGTTYSGYTKDQQVTIGENVTVPAGCTNAATGDTGTKTLVAGSNVFSILNTVTCPATVTVNKTWVIDGTTYANGNQPAGYSATLTLTGQTSPSFGTTYQGYYGGDSVSVGESATVPEECTNVASGDLGSHTLAAGANVFSVTNTVTCTATVQVDKTWVIDGTTYANGQQPSGFSAALTLTGQTDPSFGTVYSGYHQNDSVTIGESATVPSGCTNAASGDLGAVILNRGANTYTVTNTVTCPATVQVIKKWVINGVAYDNGSQPDGISAALTLTGQTDPSFGVVYDGYTLGQSVTIGENVDLAEGCTNQASGDTGDKVLATGANVFTITNTVTCAPNIAIVKQVTGTAQNPDGTWTITYSVTVTNDSTVSQTTYDLADTLHFGGGITVDSANWSGPTGTGAFSSGSATMATDRVLAAGATETYTVTVVATVTAAAWSGQSTTCPPNDTGTGGFLNTATVSSGDYQRSSSACATPGAPVPPVNPPKASSALAGTGSDIMPPIGLAAALVALGAMLMGWMWRRRRDSDGLE